MPHIANSVHDSDDDKSMSYDSDLPSPVHSDSGHRSEERYLNDRGDSGDSIGSSRNPNFRGTASKINSGNVSPVKKNYDLDAISTLLLLKGPSMGLAHAGSEALYEPTREQQDAAENHQPTLLRYQEKRKSPPKFMMRNASQFVSHLGTDSFTQIRHCNKCNLSRANNFKLVHDIIRAQTLKYDPFRKHKDKLMRSKEYRVKHGYLELDNLHKNSVASSLSSYHGKDKLKAIPFRLNHDVLKLSEKAIGVSKASKWEQIELRRKQREKEKYKAKKSDPAFSQKVLAVSALAIQSNVQLCCDDALCKACKERHEVGLVPFMLKHGEAFRSKSDHEKLRFDPCARYKSFYKELSPSHIHGILTIGSEFGISFPIPTGFTKLELPTEPVNIGSPFHKKNSSSREAFHTKDIEGRIHREGKRSKMSQSVSSGMTP